MKKKIRLTESQIQEIIEKSVRRALSEGFEPEGEDLTSMIYDYVEGESLDMEDEFSKEEICDMVQEIMAKFQAGQRVVDLEYGDYEIRANNSRGSFISWSGEEGTGMSERGMAPFYVPGDEIGDYEIGGLVSALNQAWYSYNYEL